jgi:predicted TIM-barrel fold metal-dependent hydrolase
LIIDFHTHLLPEEFRTARPRFLRADPTFKALFSRPTTRIATAGDLLAEMDANGVDRAVTLGYGWQDAGVARISNDYLLEAAARSNGRLVPFCSVNPVWGRKAVEEIERCAAAGARGVGELHPDTQGFDIADEATMRPLMSAAESLGLIVTTHSSEPVGHDYPGKGTVTPEHLLSLATSFPRVRLVLAHWGGGLAFYSLMPEVERSVRRVWFDSAATTLLYDPGVYRAVATAAGPERILFGSDFPLVSLARALGDVRAASLEPAESAVVLGGNAATLLS